MGAENGLSAAQVRFVQISPGSPEMDFYVNGTAAAYGVGYENFTSYMPVSPGSASLSANRSGLGQTLASAQTALSGGRQYTMILSHGLGSLQEHIYADQDTPAPAGQMALRVLNEVEGLGAMTVYIAAAHRGSAPATAISVPAASVSGYIAAPATDYTVTATQESHGVNLPLGTVTVKASSGGVRTVVFAGAFQPETHNSVVGFTLIDADAP